MVGTFVSTTLYQRSPLDNLVRQSSGKILPSSSSTSSPISSKLLVRHGDAATVSPHSPPSPLLQTRFKAHSASSAATSSYLLDFRGDDGDPEMVRTGLKSSRHDDRDSFYHDTSHDSYDSQTLTYPTPGFQYVIDAVNNKSSPDLPSPVPSSAGIVPHERTLSYVSAFSQDDRPQFDVANRTVAGNPDSLNDPMIPQVVVSSPAPSVRGSFNTERPSIDDPSQNASNPPKRTLTQYNVSNFSRPRRQFTPEDEQRKLEVLERNRAKSQSPTSDARSGTSMHHPPSTFPNPYSNQTPTTFNDAINTARMSPSEPSQFRPSAMRATSPTGVSIPSSLHPGQRGPAPLGRYSPNPSPSPSHIPSPSPDYSNTRSAEPSQSTSDNQQQLQPQPRQRDTVRLPNSPPSPRITSRVSLYSTYSYYQLDDSRTPSPSTPTPTATEFGVLGNSRARTPTDQTMMPRTTTPTTATPSQPSPEDYLFLGIQHHEANRLQDSAVCFERAATVEGGCGVGMLMWGLTLRHGWGVRKDEKAGFIWLRRAAEAAVEDLEAAREGKEQNAVKSELVLAIYEVGQCFFHGWGVHQDKKMAVSYFRVAARLGDADAQQELAFCLVNGKGCKKDRKEAAKWYRAAVEQGASSVGLAWIYKPKFL